MHVDSLAQLDHRLEAGARTLGSWSVHGLDLRERGAELLRLHVTGATFLGCTLDPADEDALGAAGALVLPAVPSCPLDPHRSDLYAPEELYDTARYAESLDARVYAWSQRVPHRQDTLAAALHDHAIGEALTAWIADDLDGAGLCGVMGGHALQRDDPAYADAARLGHALGGRVVVATGGGPGAMEAANLGARFAAGDAAALADAVTRLATVASFRDSVDDWIAVARDVLTDAPEPTPSLGVPTWFYGHEPANQFATAIAKYVGNALREAVLLEICNAGIVFLPGAAGTVQEVFQDACENYYADESAVAPMVLVGRQHWTEETPVWPLLRRLSRGRIMEQRIHLVDTVDEAVAIVAG